LYVDGREVPMKSGCPPDLFGIAAVLDVPFRVEDTCAATGAPIHVDFVPDGFERVDPPEAVTVLLPIGELQASISGASSRSTPTSAPISRSSPRPRRRGAGWPAIPEAASSPSRRCSSDPGLPR